MIQKSHDAIRLINSGYVPATRTTHQSHSRTLFNSRSTDLRRRLSFFSLIFGSQEIMKRNHKTMWKHSNKLSPTPLKIYFCSFSLMACGNENEKSSGLHGFYFTQFFCLSLASFSPFILFLPFTNISRTYEWHSSPKQETLMWSNYVVAGLCFVAQQFIVPYQQM